MRRVLICSLVFLLSLAASQMSAQTLKLDAALLSRATLSSGRSPVIVSPLNPAVDLLIQVLGGTLGRALPGVNARVADLPNIKLLTLAGSLLVQKIALDRPTAASNERTSATVGANVVRDVLGYDGRGV